MRELTCQVAVVGAGPAGLAAAALMVACATGIAITVMIASFRVSVTDWLAALLRADIYVSLPTRAAAGGQPLAAVRTQIDALPAVGATSAVVRSSARADQGRIQLLAYDLPTAARPGFQFVAGSANAVWTDWHADSVMITEPFAYHHGLAPGDRLRIDTRGFKTLLHNVVKKWSSMFVEHLQQSTQQRSR